MALPMDSLKKQEHRFEVHSYNHDGWEREARLGGDDLGQVMLACLKACQDVPGSSRNHWYNNEMRIKFEGKVLFTIHKEGAQAFYPTL